MRAKDALKTQEELKSEAPVWKVRPNKGTPMNPQSRMIYLEALTYQCLGQQRFGQVNMWASSQTLELAGNEGGLHASDSGFIFSATTVRNHDWIYFSLLIEGRCNVI